MKIKIVWVGRTRDPWVKEAVAEYAGRVRRYCQLELVEAREEKGADPAEQRRRECERLEKLIPAGAVTVLLDETGEQLTSPAFAAYLGRQRDCGVSELVLVIGGAYGFNDGLRRRGRLLALSQLTFTHQMVRPILLEQLYRAFTILHGE